MCFTRRNQRRPVITRWRPPPPALRPADRFSRWANSAVNFPHVLHDHNPGVVRGRRVVTTSSARVPPVDANGNDAVSGFRHGSDRRRRLNQRRCSGATEAFSARILARRRRTAATRSLADNS